MAAENVYMIIYPNGEISHTSEGITFVCDDPLWIMIPPQTSLQDLKNLILMHTGMVAKKEITKLTYRMPVAVANSFSYQKMQIKADQHVLMMFSYHRSIGSIYSLELCLNLQDIGGSSSSSNNVEGVRNRPADDFGLVRDTSRAPSPSFNAFVPQVQNVSICEARPASFTHLGVDRVSEAANAYTSDEDEIEDFSGDDPEVVPETQPLHGDAVPPTRVEPEGGGVSSSTPAHYLSLNLGAMHSTNAEDRSSSYPLSGEMELEIGLKFLNRETAMLAVKNYNIRRSAEYKVVESDQSSCLTSTMSQDHAQLDSNVICQHIFPMVHADATICVKVLQGSIESAYGYKVSYKKVWHAKQKAIARIYGDWDESYDQLHRYLNALQAFVPGITYILLWRGI
ncbi:hypothetical protein Ahy_B10g102815 isoform A [Arachis hypogaea]|uniref:Transposase MuDR plant domain-containing protein n=1 Tax=Arachis hypogaea TaxID=3818 RepID=A0A444X2V5_ARAHY|nr:hypothetical protein Ahy_B10g102815 isoform A [Arachis hypogaea]